MPPELSRFYESITACRSAASKKFQQFVQGYEGKFVRFLDFSPTFRHSNSIRSEIGGIPKICGKFNATEFLQNAKHATLFDIKQSILDFLFRFCFQSIQTIRWQRDIVP